MEVLKLWVVQGVQAFNLGLPILAEELNRKPASRRAKAQAAPVLIEGRFHRRTYEFEDSSLRNLSRTRRTEGGEEGSQSQSMLFLKSTMTWSIWSMRIRPRRG
jgi:hypothetical protein